MIFKILPDATVPWRGVWLGAILTAALFELGKYLIGTYLGRASIGTAYGAAGSMVVLLVWVYYSAQILFFGAEFTKTYTRRLHAKVKPEPHAVPVTEEARAQQGITHREVVQAVTEVARQKVDDQPCEEQKGDQVTKGAQVVKALRADEKPAENEAAKSADSEKGES